MILYVAIGSIVLLAITGFFQNNLTARSKTKAITEVDQQGAQIMQTITQAIINAESINSPAVGGSTNTLSLAMADVASNPTVFSQAATYIYISKGANTPVALNSSLVEISNLTFTNMSQANTPGNIRIQFTLNFINNSGRFEYQWSKTFYDSVSLR